MNELTASLDVIRKTASELIEDIDRNFRQLAKERGIDIGTASAREKPAEQNAAAETIAEPKPPVEAHEPASEKEYRLGSGDA